MESAIEKEKWKNKQNTIVNDTTLYVPLIFD